MTTFACMEITGNPKPSSPVILRRGRRNRYLAHKQVAELSHHFLYFRFINMFFLNSQLTLLAFTIHI